jgi:hypothetical protein
MRKQSRSRQSEYEDDFSQSDDEGKRTPPKPANANPFAAVPPPDAPGSSVPPPAAQAAPAAQASSNPFVAMLPPVTRQEQAFVTITPHDDEDTPRSKSKSKSKSQSKRVSNVTIGLNI